MADSFFKRIWQRPPVVFPLVALFHVVMLVYNVWIFRSEPFPSEGWVFPGIFFLYTICWLFVCDLKRWAAFGYVILTATSIILRYTLKDWAKIELYADTLFPYDILFTFFIMFFYKRFK